MLVFQPLQYGAAFVRLIRHQWTSTSTRRALPVAALQRLTAHIAASERLHTGEIRICAEGCLPWSYIRRHAPIRERAIMLFGKLRVWDTAQNNGVLIYLLMPEHAIELVADRGLAAKVPAQEWQAMVSRMSYAFRQAHFEEGLRQAIDEVTAQLIHHFPSIPGALNENELPDEPVIQ